MDVGEIVQTDKGSVGVIIEAYPGLRDAWTIELWNTRAGRLVQVAKWGKDLTVLEEFQ